LNKITDPDYFLPKILALNGIRILSTGSTIPQLIRGVCETTNEKGDYVLKPLRNNRIIPTSSCVELLATFIAMELDLNVVPPVLIEITDLFVETFEGTDQFKTLAESKGINFGTKYIEGTVELVVGQDFEWLPKEAENIFSFDLFISNPDRRNIKPNLLLNGDRILIFDHELAFSFLLMYFGSAPQPGEIPESEMDWIKNHYFYEYLKGNERDFNDFVDKFADINENFWATAEKLIPEEWMGDHFTKIKNTLNAFILNKENFKKELKRILL